MTLGSGARFPIWSKSFKELHWIFHLNLGCPVTVYCHWIEKIDLVLRNAVSPQLRREVPGSRMVHSSHLNTSLGSDTSPTPAMFTAEARNWYRWPSSRLLTFGFRSTNTFLAHPCVVVVSWGEEESSRLEELEENLLNPRYSSISHCA